jgi:hypothetical protein
MGDMMNTRREQETEAAAKTPVEEEQRQAVPEKVDTALDYEFKRLKELNPDDFE